jgi:hypothetical protein
VLLSLLTLTAISAAPEPLAVARRTVDLHNACRKSHEQAVCLEAARSYRAYFQLGTTDPRDASLRFFWGELLYDQFEAHAEAKRQYQLALKLDPTGKYAQLAAYDAMLAADQVLRRAKSEGRLEEPKIRDLKEALAIPSAAIELVEACDQYRARFPDADRVPEAAYQAAKVFYDYNHLEAAVARLSEVAESPKAETGLAETAANLVIESYRLNQDWVQLLGWARRFHARQELGTPGFRDDLVRTIATTEIEVRGLKGRDAAAVLRAAVAKTDSPAGRERLLEDAAQWDGDYGPIVELRMRKLDEDASLLNLAEAAATLELAGRPEEAEAVRRWEDWVRAYEIAADPPAEPGCEEDCIGISEE